MKKRIEQFDSPHRGVDLTILLEQVHSGDRSASDRLFEVVYGELKQMASHQMVRESSGHTLQSTALVHEAWLKLFGAQSAPSWKNRGHFFAAASKAMRRILVDSARSRQRKKRGGDNVGFQIRDDAQVAERDLELLALDEALEQLKAHDAIKAKLVTMRYFGGFSNKQAAEQLGISTSTADRHWTYARAWLRKKMTDNSD